MKKQAFFAIVLIAVTICATIFPIKESKAVRAWEWIGTSRQIVCYDKFATEVTTGGSIGIAANGQVVSIGGSTKTVYKSLEGRETTCDGWSGTCNGTNCEPLGGQQL